MDFGLCVDSGVCTVVDISVCGFRGGVIYVLV